MMQRFTLAVGQDTISFEAAPGVRWEVRSRYINERGTEWETNANGQSYGVLKGNREPDLQAVTATNGASGYVFTRDLNNVGGPPPTDLGDSAVRQPVSADIPVYESDGTTRIGTFHVGS
ncbi:hypothetical protein DFJ68_1305 [Terracoccus luteus]|uniref:Uncharacterized protein n=2 Tax=Terracoccus luteus TaxID=53356 RepID=A0A495XYS6_9MICO|nr:hypothetical protein DFJ68_1305 [Terracoccus luteus]